MNIRGVRVIKILPDPVGFLYNLLTFLLMRGIYTRDISKLGWSGKVNQMYCVGKFTCISSTFWQFQFAKLSSFNSVIDLDRNSAPVQIFIGDCILDYAYVSGPA
jgi:hypothetical protein